MNAPERAGSPSLAFAVVLAVLAAAGAAVGEAPLTGEDVVRAWVNGTTVEALVARIASSEVDFDVSREMLDEFRAAGLPAEVIDAMRRRQAEQDAAANPEPEPEPDDGPLPALTVVLNAAERKAVEDERDARNTDHPLPEAPVLRFLDVVPPPLADTLSLPGEQRRFTDAALVLACTSTRHVPDHWRSKTPLGRDFVNTPRHKLIAWVAGARQVEQGKLGKFLGNLAGARQLADAAILELELPEKLEGLVEPGEDHDLILGLALEAGGRFYLIRAETREAVPAGATLNATFKTGALGVAQDLTVRWED